MLEIFGVGYPIDLIPFEMGDVYVIVGMDWLSRFGAMIDYEWQMVIVRDPSSGMLTIYGKGTRSGSALCSAARARQSLQHGCMGYLAYVVVTQVEEKGTTSIYDVPVVCDFPDVFPEEWSF